MTVISHWSVGGHINSQVSDHTSVIQFLEQWTGVQEPNISSWRRTACGDLTSAFDFKKSHRQPTADKPGPVPAPISRWKPTPPAEQALPLQEPGRRPARALPYQPTVSGFVAGSKLKLRLGNKADEAAHFAIYPYGGELPAPAHLDVRGQLFTDVPVSGPYELAVQGPNRFWVELAGSVEGAAAGLDVRVSKTGTSLHVELENTGTKPLSVKLKSRGFGARTINQDVRGRQTRTLTWPTDQGWYDLEVTTAEDPTYRRRLTGHLESGTPSVTG
jgi:phospholipase C